jgi:TonB-linked SusC/RagA family outer membrane protein
MLGFSASAVEAQTGQVVGQVRDASSGAPLGEVQVHIPTAGVGVLSRADGRFVILNVPAGSYELRAERIGFAAGSQQITVTAGQATQVDFALESQALGLDEIVVTGTAGASRRREVGNSIAQIDLSSLNERPAVATDILQSSQPGIEITGGSGEIGQGKAIRLRGNSSVSMSNQPIIYIDGVRIMSGAFPQTAGRDYRAGRGANVTASPLDALNPNDIERIEVIKGSAATTLYGTEASAGVIQVFTKRGAQGAPVWTAEVQQGTGWLPVFGNPCRRGDVDFPAGFTCEDDPSSNYMFTDNFLRDGWFGIGGGNWGETIDGEPNAYYDGREGGSMWTQYYGLSVRGGGQNLQYFASGSFDDQLGNLPNDALEKWVVRGNFTFTPQEDLQFQWNTGYTNQWQQNTATGNNAQGITLNTFRRERNYFGTDDFNAVAQVLPFDLQQRIERFTTGGTVTYSPLANLTNRFTVGYDFSQQEARNLRPYGFNQRPRGAIQNNMWQNRLLTFDYVGSYSYQISEPLRTSFSWGGQAVGNEIRELEGWGEEFPGAAEPTVSSASIKIAEESREKVWNAGFFFQNVLDITNKYFLTLGVRVDGNSAFGEGFGLQVYPKASFSWVISDEDFWPENFGQVKLRTAYGQSGRAPGAFDAVRTWDPAGWAGSPAFVPQNVGNPDLGPEITGEFEVGFDGSWIDDRVSATFTYFNQRTTDALMNVTQSPSTGFTGSQLENVGEISNEGFELGLNFGLVQSENYGWDLGVNVSTTSSEVVSLGGAAPFSALNGWIEEGQPVPVERADVVTNPTEIAAPEFDTDVNLGPNLPTRQISVNTSVRLPRGIVVSANGEYRGGHIVNTNPISIGRSVRSPLCAPFYVNPETSVTLKAETPALWRARCTPSLGEGYYYDGDYFKLRTVSATVPVDFAFPDRVSNASLTLSLNNSWLWMKDVAWMDPEILGNDGANEPGLGASERTPAPVTFRISLRVTF